MMAFGGSGNRRMVPCCTAWVLIVCAGCELPKTGKALLSGQQEARSDAQQRWDDLRGSARLQVAERHLKAGRFDEAEKELNIIHAAVPNNVKAYKLATQLWLEKGELARARDAVTRAAALSDDPEVEFLAGIVAERYDDPALALEHFERASRNAPRVVDYVLARIETLLTVGREFEALALTEASMRDFDANVQLRTLAAQIHRSLGLRAPTIDRAREAVRLSDGEIQAIAELGSSLVWAGRNSEAIELLQPLVNEAAVAGAPQGNSSDTDGRVPEPERSDIALYLGRAYLQDGQPVKAMQVFRRLASQESDNAVAWSFYANAAVMAGEFQEAAGALETARREKPSTELDLLSSFVAYRLDDFDQAFEFARRVLARDDRSVDAYCLLGQSAEAMGELDTARKAYTDALAIEPQSVLVRSLLHALAEDRLDHRIDAANEHDVAGPRVVEGRTASAGNMETP